MKRLSICFIALVSCAGLSRAQTPQSAAAPSAPRALANNDATYVKLRNIRIGEDTIPVKDFTLKRDAGTFLFKSGTFYLLEPVNGRITGAVFLGDAAFTLTPPIEVERRYLSILTKASLLRSSSPARSSVLRTVRMKNYGKPPPRARLPPPAMPMGS